jgi:hypothetical protein
MFAPRLLRKVYREELELLDRYASDASVDTRPRVSTGRGVISLA